MSSTTLTLQQQPEQTNIITAKHELATAKHELATAKQELTVAEQKLTAAKQELTAAEHKGDERMKEFAQDQVGCAMRGIKSAQEGVETAQHAVTLWSNYVLKLSGLAPSLTNLHPDDQQSPGHQTPQKPKEEEKIGSKSSSPTKPLESTHYDHINMQNFWNGIKHATIIQHQVDIDSQYIDDMNDDNQPLVSTTVQVKADVLDLGGGGYVFGDQDLKLSKLLVRDHYVNLWNIIEQEVKTRMPKWIVTGTPGIGKSCFLAYMLYKLSLIQEPNQLIIWCSNAYGKSCIFHSDGNVEVIDGGDSGMRYAYREGYLHESTWLLSDDVKPKFSPCKILLVSSPNTDVWKDFEKQYAERRYLPVWTPREILLAHRTVYSHLTTEQVLDTLSLVGGIPRRIFNVMQHFNATNYLKEGLLTDFNNIEMYCDSVGELCHTTEKANHRLLHMGNPPGDTSYTEGRVLFASSYVASLIADKLEQKNANDIMKIVNGSEGAGKMGAWRGQLFEGLVHNHLSKGGPFTIRSLHDGHEEDIDIKIDGDVVVFNSIDELEQVINTRNVYARPKITNYESIDCLITPNYLFQSTVSGHHEIKVHGLKLVTQSLQKHCQEQQQFKLIFVVPPDRYDDWQKIQCYKTSTNAIAKHPPTNVTQWVMSLNLSHTKLLTPNKGKRSRDSSLSLPSSTASPSSSPSPSPSLFPSHPSPSSVNSKRQKQFQSQQSSPAQVHTTTLPTAEQYQQPS